MSLKQPNTQRAPQATPMPAAEAAEHALVQHKLVLEALLESTADFIYMKDRNGRYVFANSSAARSVGMTPQEIIGKDDRALFPEEHARHIMEKDRQIMASGVSEVFEETRAYAGGGVRHLHSSKNVCRDSSGAVIGIVGISRDITDLKRAEEALNSSELNAAGARMANALAHEINNPLAALTNALFLLRQGNVASADQLLVAAQDSLWRITKITRQMIGLYNRTAAARHIQVQDVVQDTLANLNMRVRKKGIRFKPDFSPCEFYGIDADLRQLITAVLENAVEQAHSLVRIKLYSPTAASGDPQPEFRLVIADDGPGIAPEHRDRIFEPFFSTKAEKGSGLGLWMARGIANKYGGRIRVRSRTAKGSSWTCLVVTMPARRTVSRTEK